MKTPPKHPKNKAAQNAVAIAFAGIFFMMIGSFQILAQSMIESPVLPPQQKQEVLALSREGWGSQSSVESLFWGVQGSSRMPENLFEGAQVSASMPESNASRFQGVAGQAYLP